jgi:hypothetical protein
MALGLTQPLTEMNILYYCYPVAVVQCTYTTNSTWNDTKQTIHGTTQKLGRVRAVPCLCGFYPGICFTTEKKHGKPSVSVAMHRHTIRIHRHYNKNTLITVLNTNKTIYTVYSDKK